MSHDACKNSSKRLLSHDDMLGRVLGTLGIRNIARRMFFNGPKWLQRLAESRRIRLRERLVDSDELIQKYRDAVQHLYTTSTFLGDYLEFGVYNGTSLICMHRVLKDLGIGETRLIGFDSFEGLPDVAATDSDGRWRPGQFRSSHEFTKRVLSEEGVDWARTTLVKGFFSETLTERTREQLRIKRAGVIMVDCDLYQSTVEALAFCEPLILDTTIVFFDDWYPLADRSMGEKLAFDQFLASNPALCAEEFTDFAPNGKAFVVKRTTAS